MALPFLARLRAHKHNVVHVTLMANRPAHVQYERESRLLPVPGPRVRGLVATAAPCWLASV